jgi:membrane protein
VISVLIQIIPYTLIWILLTLTYLILPNTKVNFKSAVIAGVLAGTLYQLTQWGYITFQVGVARYGAIYGTFAAVPLFMIWIQLSWLIVLYGAEISYAIQNTRGFKAKKEHPELDNYHKKLVCLYITYHIVKRFEKGEDPWTANELSLKLHIPLYYAQSMLQILIQQRVLIELSDGNEPRYQPARDINSFSTYYIIKQVEQCGVGEVPTIDSEVLQQLRQKLDHFEKLMQDSKENLLLKDLRVSN